MSLWKPNLQAVVPLYSYTEKSLEASESRQEPETLGQEAEALQTGGGFRKSCAPPLPPCTPNTLKMSRSGRIPQNAPDLSGVGVRVPHQP